MIIVNRNRAACLIIRLDLRSVRLRLFLSSCFCPRRWCKSKKKLINLKALDVSTTYAVDSNRPLTVVQYFFVRDFRSFEKLLSDLFHRHVQVSPGQQELTATVVRLPAEFVRRVPVVPQLIVPQVQRFSRHKNHLRIRKQHRTVVSLRRGVVAARRARRCR